MTQKAVRGGGRASHGRRRSSGAGLRRTNIGTDQRDIGSIRHLHERGREVVDRRTFIVVGHRRFLLGGVRHCQENLDGPPLQRGPPVRARPRLATLNSVRPLPVIYRRDVTRTFPTISCLVVDPPDAFFPCRRPGPWSRACGRRSQMNSKTGTIEGCSNIVLNRCFRPPGFSGVPPAFWDFRPQSSAWLSASGYWATTTSAGCLGSTLL